MRVQCPRCGFTYITEFYPNNPFDPDSCQCEDCGYQDYPQAFDVEHKVMTKSELDKDMELKGFIPCDGRKITEENYPLLFAMMKQMEEEIKRSYKMMFLDTAEPTEFRGLGPMLFDKVGTTRPEIHILKVREPAPLEYITVEVTAEPKKVVNNDLQQAINRFMNPTPEEEDED